MGGREADLKVMAFPEEQNPLYKVSRNADFSSSSSLFVHPELSPHCHLGHCQCHHHIGNWDPTMGRAFHTRVGTSPKDLSQGILKGLALCRPMLWGLISVFSFPSQWQAAWVTILKVN